MALATLSIDIVAKLASLQDGMTRAERLVQQSVSRMDKVLSGVRGAAGTVGAALGGAFAVTGLNEWLRATTDGIDAFNDLSDITGASIENISALENVALRTGHSFDAVADAITKLNKGLIDTNPNSATAQALAAIGLSADELRKMDPALAVKEVADALAKYEDSADKARLVQELFGKSMAVVGPLLKDLAESGQLVATVTTEQAAAADRWNKQLAVLQANATSLSRDIVGGLLPALSRMLVLVQALANGPGLLASLGDVAKGRLFLDAGDALKFYSAELAKVDKRIADMQGGRAPQRSIYGTDLLARAQTERSDLAKRADAYRTVVNSEGAGAGRGTGQAPVLATIPALANPRGPTAARVAGSAGGAARQVQTYADTVAQAVARMVSESDIARIGDLNAQLERLNELAAAGLSPDIVAQVRVRITEQLPDSQRAQDNPAEAFRRAEIGATDATNTALATDALAKLNAQQERLVSLLANTSSVVLDEQRRDMLLLADALQQGAISEGQYLEAVKQRLAETTATAGKTKDAGQEMGLVFASAFEDALVNTRDFGDVLKGLEKDLIRMFARKYVLKPVLDAAESALGPLLGSLFGGFFAKGGVFGSTGPVIPFANGGVFSNQVWDTPQVFKFAQGGAMATGVLGEAGPEAVMPLARGPGGKLGVRMHGGSAGGVVINQYITVGEGVSKNGVMAAMQVAKAQAIAEITDNHNRGRSPLR